MIKLIKNLFKNKYRIVTDNYAGYEVQIKRWWFPFYVQLDMCNTFSTIEKAEKYARLHSQLVVKELDF